MFQRKTVRWSVVAAATAAGILLTVEFRRGQGDRPTGTGLAWADVVQQLQSARTARLSMVQADPALNGGRELVQTIYLKTPGRIRMETKDPSTLHDMVVIVNGQEAAILHPAEKRYDTAPNNVIPISSAGDLLRLFGGPPISSGGSGAQSRPAFGDQVQLRLISCGLQERNSRKLEKHRLEQFTAETSTRIDSGGNQVFCWIEPAKGEVVLMTNERVVNGEPIETVHADVQLNIELPDDLFSTAKPNGYNVGAVATTKVNVNEVLGKYEQARQRINHYRLMVGNESKNSSGFVPYRRCARDGANLRMDDVQAPASNTDTGFDALWNQLKPQPNGVSIYVRGWRIVRILWKDGKIGDFQEPEQEDSEMGEYTLAGFGWPRLPVNLLLTIVSKSGEAYHALPPRADRPGLIGIQYTQKPSGRSGIGRMQIFWLDPAREYLCVFHEDHQRKGAPWQGKPDWKPAEPQTVDAPKGTGGEFDTFREIIEFGRTPDGRWYPKAVRRDGARVTDGKRYCFGPYVTRVQADFTGPIPADLFEWPAKPAKLK